MANREVILAKRGTNAPSFGSVRWPLRAKIDSKNGNIVELMSKRIAHNPVDTSLDEAVNKYLFLEGLINGEHERAGAHRNRGTRSPRCHDPYRVFRTGKCGPYSSRAIEGLCGLD